jgi:hypothetical protein
MSISIASGYLSKYLFIDILSKAFYLNETREILWLLNTNTRLLLMRE